MQQAAIAGAPMPAPIGAKPIGPEPKRSGIGDLIFAFIARFAGVFVLRNGNFVNGAYPGAGLRTK